MMVILFRLLLVPVVIVCALPLVVIGAFVALALTGHALDLSASIGMPMLIDIMLTNAIMLHEIEAGADVRAGLLQSGRTRVRRILMTAAATILAIIPHLDGPGGQLLRGLQGVQATGRATARQSLPAPPRARSPYRFRPSPLLSTHSGCPVITGTDNLILRLEA
jgi:HAE1 family hydrophobic/amphiphilic exporter-1